MVTRKDYSAEAVQAAKSVLIELTHLLGEYREDIVLIGGWVPELIIPQGQWTHVGSIDVDLALNHTRIKEAGYRRIEELLLSRGYYQDKDRQPYIFLRDIIVGGSQYTVEVDLLAGEYQGTGKTHRHQEVQGIKARKARGCELAFDMTTEVNIEGEVPGGGLDRVTIRVAAIVPFFVMKGMALVDRMKEKDAWDIYYCIRSYPGGIEVLVREFEPHKDNGLVQEGLGKIASKFASEKDIGPRFVSDFEEADDPDEIERIRRDAFERVHAFLEKLGY